MRAFGIIALANTVGNIFNYQNLGGIRWHALIAAPCSNVEVLDHVTDIFAAVSLRLTLVKLEILSAIPVVPVGEDDAHAS